MRNEYRAIQTDMIEKLYEQYKGQLMKFAYRLSGNEDMAKDILQESFLKLHKLQQSGKVITNHKSLIFRITYNLFIDQTRKSKNQIGNYTSVENLTDNNPGPEKSMIQLERMRLIKGGISKLKKKERGLVALYAENFSYQEMAEVLGMKKSSVGKTLSRCIEKIQMSVKKEV